MATAAPHPYTAAPVPEVAVTAKNPVPGAARLRETAPLRRTLIGPTVGNAGRWLAFRNTDRLPEPPLPTARSPRPSPLKSPAASACGPVPPAGRGKPGASENRPVPSPVNTAIVFELPLATARSSNPSPLRSQAVMALGPVPPLGNGEPGAGLKLPLPLPSRIEIVLDPKLATARSALPSPLKSPATIASGLEPPLENGEPGARPKLPLGLSSRTETLF